jgi:hypothetical protein
LRSYSEAQPQQPIISVSPLGSGVRIYATLMPREEKVRLLQLALDHIKQQEGFDLCREASRTPQPTPPQPQS